MAFGEYISGDAEQKYASMEHSRETWELENDPEGEVKEMVDLYIGKGFDKTDAETVIKTMSKCGSLSPVLPRSHRSPDSHVYHA